MSLLHIFKTNSCCIGGTHYSGTTGIYESYSSKTTKMLKGSCTYCRQNRSMIVSDATIKAEGLKDFFKRVGISNVNFGKKVANDPVRSLEIASRWEVQLQLETLKLL